MIHPADHRPGRQRTPGAIVRIVLAVLLPLAVAASLYAFGRSHQPAYTSSLFGQYGDSANGLKARLGTALLGLALLQLLLALWMYRRLPGASRAPAPIRTVHRLTGLTVFVLSLPIAYHCITAYGVRLTTTRTAIHSITGCVFYGAFTAKVLLVRSSRLPGWALPAAGGSLVTAVGLLWYTAALWWLNGSAAPGL